MDLAKCLEFLDPTTIRERIHIVGCGAIGSTVAENLARFGLGKNLILYDFDVVKPHNIANQMFTSKNIGTPKVDAVKEMVLDIDPDATSIRTASKGYTNQPMSGYVFLCVDSIETRRKIAEAFVDNPNIKGMFDFRMGLTDAQHFAADWKDRTSVHSFLNSMDFTHEEAMANAPVSACNMTLSVAPTVRMIVAAGVANFINFAKKGKLKKLILVDAFDSIIDAFN